MGSHLMWGQMMELVMPRRQRHREDVGICVTHMKKLSGESEVPEWSERKVGRGEDECGSYVMAGGSSAGQGMGVPMCL